ncbi:hypothetical protein AB0C52_23675 [Streptomyces sp. NPDC048717]
MPHPDPRHGKRQRRQAAATEAAALRRAREEKAGRRTEPQNLGQTA